MPVPRKGGAQYGVKLDGPWAQADGCGAFQLCFENSQLPSEVVDRLVRRKLQEEEDNYFLLWKLPFLALQMFLFSLQLFTLI